MTYSTSIPERLVSGLANAAEFEAQHIAYSVFYGGITLLSGLLIQTVTTTTALFFGVIGAAEAFIRYPAAHLINIIVSEDNLQSVTLGEVAQLVNELFCKALVWGTVAAIGIVAAPTALAYATAAAFDALASRIENIILINTPKDELENTAYFTCLVRITLIAGSCFALATLGFLSPVGVAIVGTVFITLAIISTKRKTEEIAAGRFIF